MKGYRESRSPWLLIVFILIGALLGSVAGASFSDTLPILKKTQSLGFPATTFNLIVAQFTIGMRINLNLAAVAGAALAWFAYRRM